MESKTDMSSASTAPRNLAQELEGVGETAESRYWTYGLVPGKAGDTDGDLAAKWGLGETTEGGTVRLTRAARKGQEFSAVQREDKGRLNRHFADLDHQFNKNPDEVPEATDHGTGNDSEERVESYLSGGLVAGNSELAQEGAKEGTDVGNMNQTSGTPAEGGFVMATHTFKPPVTPVATNKVKYTGGTHFPDW
ncbi:hypothetical protein M378DRAFT_108377, partial [Amanita muscaria Koide BX008]